MKVFAALLCAFVCLCLIQPAWAQNTYTLEQVFAKMDEVQKGFRSTQADIERTHVTILVNDKNVSSGKFHYTRRGKEPRVRLELTKPANEQVLIDKGKMQLYRPRLNEVQEGSLGPHKNKVEMLMALGFGQSSQDLKKNFDVTLAGEEVLDGKKTIALELKPKDTKMFKSVRMWMDVDKWVATQLKFTEGSGDYMIVKFTNIKMNPNIANSVFDLKMPKNVRVLKM